MQVCQIGCTCRSHFLPSESMTQDSSGSWEMMSSTSLGDQEVLPGEPDQEPDGVPDEFDKAEDFMLQLFLDQLDDMSFHRRWNLLLGGQFFKGAIGCHLICNFHHV